MQRDISQLQHTNFDLIIVGAGIHGACTARDAALRGLKVALIDKGDISGATSHNSLKTIHGGIRYLQHFDIKRTIESINEQKYWLRTAPHLMQTIPFMMPTYGYGTRGNEAMWLGIKAYEIFAFGRNKTIPAEKRLPAGKIISAQHCQSMIPQINSKELRGAAIWHDVQVVNPDQAVIQISQHATLHGAIVANYLSAQKLIIEKNSVQGIHAFDSISKKSFYILGKNVINATGPWAANWLNDNQEFMRTKHSLPLTKSMNIVTKRIFPNHAVGIKSTLASDAAFGKSKRLYFIIPWKDKSIIGTTHNRFDNNNINNAFSMETTRSEISQFVDQINKAYPPAKLKLSDVLYCYQGMTPANEPYQHPAATRLQHSKIIDHDTTDGLNGLVSLISVKWTTARTVAERAVNIIANKLGNSEPCLTRKNNIPNTSLDLALNANSSNTELNHFVHHAIQNEMALTISDLLFRRCDALMTNVLTPKQIKFLFDSMAQQMEWNKQQQQIEKETLLRSWLQPELHKTLTDIL